MIQSECASGVSIVELDGRLQCLQDIFQILTCCGDRYNLFMKRLFVEGLLLLGHVAVSIQVAVMFEVLFHEITGVLIREQRIHLNCQLLPVQILIRDVICHI